MKIGVLGTGMVGECIGSKLVSLGHEVMMGSRTADNEKGKAWAKKAGDKASLGTFADAAAHGEILFNCGKGEATLAILEAAGAENLRGKVLLDISNPLDFSKGFPPTLTVCNTESLGEQIQSAYPDLQVVKTLNTMNTYLMVDPTGVPGDHTVFVCGNHDGAKQKAKQVLTEWFGWSSDSIIDLGDLTGARGTEAWLLLWTRIFAATGNPNFNIEVRFGPKPPM
jgi:hypothetical protein